METEPSKPKRSPRFFVAALAILILAGSALGLAWFARQFLLSGGPDAVELSAEDVEHFFVGVAALDVEANERALAEFQLLTQRLPQEPAVWANLGILRLRVNENQAAAEALSKAAELAPDNKQIALLQALVDERAGNFEQAIQRLEQIPNPDAPALYMLASMVERTGSEDATRERLNLIDRILEQQPQNAVAQFQRARLAARLQDADQLNEAMRALAERRSQWSEAAVKQYEAAQAAATAGQFNEAAKSLTFLENVSKTSFAYQEGLAALGVTAGSVGTPLREFLTVPDPTVTVAEADMALDFEMQSKSRSSGRPELFLAAALSNEDRVTELMLVDDKLHVGTAAELPFPRGDATRPVGKHAVLSVDLNADLRAELVVIGAKGLAIFVQDKQGQFTPWSPKENVATDFQQPGDGVWSLDFEADGDLDLLLAKEDGNSQLLRNNGDMTFTPVETFNKLPAPRELQWCDLDNDGDVDLATLDRDGRVLISWNERAGMFRDPAPLDLPTTAAALAVGDLDFDGMFDLLALDRAGAIQHFSYDRGRNEWSRKAVANWEQAPPIQESFDARKTSLWLADLDNNGAIDLVASAGTNTAIWLNDSQHVLQRLEHSPSLFILSVTDMNGDGLLDLAGLTAEGAQVAHGKGSKGYHWQVLLARANTTAADQRINSFGLGGRVEVRAGKLLQAAPIDSPLVHFGLGQHQRAAVARIVWPNGSIQAEFDLKADQTAIAQQRLKGSCPFVFARGKEGFVFVKDFIWRSPLGLKINSQDTAGVNQTEDWIKIPGEFLTLHNGRYEVRITAELWETHFFDHISLLTVDHPSAVEAIVDERFIAAQSPALEVKAVTPPRPLQSARDEAGRDVLGPLKAVDGEHLDSFALGKFQGLAEEHVVEFELDDNLPTDQPVFLVGQGWIYPTDSSLNVAISQGDFPRPHGLLLEVPESDGTWRAISGDLGFPAGKNKTVLIPLPSELLRDGERRFRMRTNMEVYWDFLGWAAAATEEVTTERVNAKSAELRYRGFSELSPLDRRKPDLPTYERLSGHAQRWRDLEGYYTRFGDIRELLETTDDRYVIMNAGDEIVLQFAAGDPPPEGWKRDFVLIGDGWVKDGDYNTAHSRTVHPLPTHADSDYSAHGGSLFDDPTFQEHRDDWERFHTRYVTPRSFERGLWPAGASRTPGVER